MAGKKKTKIDDGQLDLIDVQPENAKKIIEIAKRYMVAQAKRLKALDQETKAKDEILALINAANLQRLEGGKIKFRCDGFVISVEPRDELVKIKNEKEGDGTD